MNALAAIQTPELGDAETEAALCAAMMVANEIIDAVADMVKVEDFSNDFFGHLFGLIVRERSLGHSATPIALKAYLDEGGRQVVAGLTGSEGAMAGAIGARDFARQISDLARRRRLVDGLRATLAQATDLNCSTDEIVADAETAIGDATRDEDGSSELSASACIDTAMKAIGSSDRGVTCGIEGIDLAMGPVRRKNLAILAGRPGMGKTAVALAYAKGAARRGHGVLFVSLEMSGEELGERIVADEAFNEDRGTGVPYDCIVNGRIDREGFSLLGRARDAIEQMPLQIIDTSAITPVRLQAAVRRWKRRFAARGKSLDLVVVDYLQKMRVPGSTNRFEVITEISQSLKELAKANDLGVLALAQLSRKVEDRPDKRPQLSDLRESGQLEQDADAVLFLLREEYYLRKTQPHPQSPDYPGWEMALRECEGQIEFICAKRRKGAERTTQGRFYGAFQAVR